MIGVLRNTLMISCFVFVMMLLIEYINVLTQGRWQTRLTSSRWGQYLLAAVLGSVPGCLGAFAVVAMYAHGILSLGAVVTAMIATSGDEAFIMLALIPRQALLITAVLFLAGMGVGMVTDALFRRSRILESLCCRGMEIHEGYGASCFPRGRILEQWKKCSAARGILTAVLAIMVIAIVTGQTVHHHKEQSGDTAPVSRVEEVSPDHRQREGEIAHRQEALGNGDLEPGGAGHGGWDWIRITLLITSLMALFIVVTVEDHFLAEHLWNHIARKHLPRIFLWTFGALAALYLLTDRLHLNLDYLAGEGKWFTLVAACLVGLIPQSGPHLVFVTLFARGMVPFSVLLANSVVQDGHGMIPMLSHSRRAFLVIKAINLLAGLALGAV
ncbi:MAG: arsenic efflux protein, partial [Candidatus Krumholzibacteriota bacterium]|nr:arsenic efflux protein [Candidatus Krumholzibacteriota bacterium]